MYLDVECGPAYTTQSEPFNGSRREERARVKANYSSRRAILRKGLGALTASSLSKLSAFSNGAQASERIIVCVYLLGGNDGNNMVIPIDQYQRYTAIRGELAISGSALLLARNGTQIAFHPSMPHVRSLFDSGSLAVVANVGSRSREFGHQDVSNLSYLRNGFLAPAWTSRIKALSSISGLPGTLPSDHSRAGAPSCVTLSGEGAIEKHPEISKHLLAKECPATFPATSLGRQLSQIASLLSSGVTTGIRQRVFFAMQAGYDTHSNQLPRQAVLFAELSEALQAFHAAAVDLGISRQVVTYTDSEFGRTLKPNRTGGSEHGWGSHQLVMGGSVAGGVVYGSFADLDSPCGVSHPGFTKDRHAATITAWAGASRAELNAAFPALEAHRPTVAFTA